MFYNADINVIYGNDMSKKELLKHKMTRMTDTMKADIQASADKHSEGVFDRELRALIEIGLKVREQDKIDKNEIGSYC